jgi:methionine-S-sulfoxide reductase
MSMAKENPVINPDYRQVCSGRTGYVEVLFLELNDPETNFEPIIRFFFQFHDPTTKNRQGNDVGTQYASVIFCEDEEQKNIANKVKDELQSLIDKGKIDTYINKKVETQILDLTPFVEAHEEHQGRSHASYSCISDYSQWIFLTRNPWYTFRIFDEKPIRILQPCTPFSRLACPKLTLDCEIKKLVIISQCTKFYTIIRNQYFLLLENGKGDNKVFGGASLFYST